MLPKRSIPTVQLCLLLILIPSSLSQYYNPDYTVNDDLHDPDHAGYRESSSSSDNSGEKPVDDRPDYSTYYQKDSGPSAALVGATAGAFDGEGAKESEYGFVSPIDFTGLFSGHFGEASNHQQSNPVIPIQNPFKLQEGLKQQNSSGFVDASDFTAAFAGAPSFDLEIGKHFANNPFEQKSEDTKEYKKQSYKSEVDDLNSFDKEAKKNYEKPKVDYNFNPALPTLSSYTGGQINHLSPVKTYIPQSFPATKHTNAPLNIQSTLAPYNFQPTINLPKFESLKSTLPPLNNYNAPVKTEFAQPSEYKAEKVQNNCQKIEKQLSPDDISHGRFRRQADKMNCFLCADPKTGGSYEQCSYTSDPDDDKAYFRGHAEKYHTKTYTDPEDHSRRRRAVKNKKNKQKRQDKEQADEYSNPFEFDKNSAHKFSSKPEAFDDAENYYQAPDFSHYEQDPVNFQYGPEYFQDAATEEKSYSELQSDELKKDGQNCKKVTKESLTCTVCSNPKTGGNYEQCSYTSEPQEKKYAYVKEKKYNSNDPNPEEKTVESTEIKPNKEKYTKPSIELEFASPSVKQPKQLSNEKHDYDYIPHHYISETKQNKRFEKAEEPAEKKDYLYKLFPEYAEKESQNREVKQRPASDLPEYFTAEESKKDVDSVLQDFAKKDRSKCKKIAKDKMTCYICLDNKGIQHEECMFVSESAPKSTHVAYHEVKEFSSDPNKKEKEAVTANSNPTPQIKSLRDITKRQNSKLALKDVDAEPTEYVKIVGNRPRIVRRKTNLSKDLLGSQEEESKIQEVRVERPKREEKKTKSEAEAEPVPPAVPQDAYASELVPVFSKKLGVTLPKYMLDISEGEKIFDEVVNRG